MRTRRTNSKTNGSARATSVVASSRTTTTNSTKKAKKDDTAEGTNDETTTAEKVPVVITPPPTIADKKSASSSSTSTVSSKKRRTHEDSTGRDNNDKNNNDDTVESKMDEDDPATDAIAPAANEPATSTRNNRRSTRESSSDQPAAEPAVVERVVPESVRVRQRAVAEREASRLARPEQRVHRSIGHADRKRSAVTSTPFGIIPTNTATAAKIIDGISTTEWCGPFSIARQMIAKREEVKRQQQAEDDDDANENGTKRESHPLDAVMIEIDNDKKRKAHPSLQWKGSISTSKQQQGSVQDNLYTKRKKRNEVYSSTKKIPTLFQSCVNYIVLNIEHVESLGDATVIDSSIRSSIVQELINCNQFNNMTLQVICEPGIETLEIIDCAAITQSDLSDQLTKLIPAGLRYLVLDQAGRCFGPATVSTIIAALSSSKSSSDDKATTSSSSLHALSIGGAYLLSDTDAARLIQFAADTGLTSLEFKGCPLLGALTLKSINESYTRNNNKLLELSLVDITWTETGQIHALVSTPDALRNLQNLTLRNVNGLNDTIMEKLLQMTNNTLIGLDISHNVDITDDTLSSLRNYGSPNLISLRLNGLRNITSSGLEATFLILTNEYDSNNGSRNGTESNSAANPNTSSSPAPPPPRLRHLELGNCYHDAVTDDVIQQVALASKISSTTSENVYNGTNSFSALTNGGGAGGLVTLNIQGSSTVTDTSMEVLVSTCGSSLVDLNVSFCPKITNKGLGYLVDSCGTQLSNISIWGNAQLSDEFIDGHQRTNDPSFRIVGNWMKHYTS